MLVELRGARTGMSHMELPRDVCMFGGTPRILAEQHYAISQHCGFSGAPQTAQACSDRRSLAALSHLPAGCGAFVATLSRHTRPTHFNATLNHTLWCTFLHHACHMVHHSSTLSAQCVDCRQNPTSTANPRRPLCLVWTCHQTHKAPPVCLHTPRLPSMLHRASSFPRTR